ncbi:unnamed protein product [Miscanthus lutarioriparius]|uniref:Pentatricopeptide repeat-containing protein n=1 Tax=Miscanthus lutarioriparius TaxID=422564 RepID=A0A811RF61_9POAL|nr:unnamed protein product [Miscanthus lutarioriparius]
MAAAGVPANRVTYNVQLKGYCQQLQIGKARELFEETVTDAGIQPGMVTYNTLMDGCVLSDDSTGALAFFNEMWSRGIAPSTVSYMTLMKAFTVLGQPKVAHKVFEEMERDPRVTVDRAGGDGEAGGREDEGTRRAAGRGDVRQPGEGHHDGAQARGGAGALERGEGAVPGGG